MSKKNTSKSISKKKKLTLSKRARSRISKDAIARRLKWQIIDKYCIPSWDNGASIYSTIKQKRPKSVPFPLSAGPSKKGDKDQVDNEESSDDDEQDEQEEVLNLDKCKLGPDENSDSDDQPDNQGDQRQMVK